MKSESESERQCVASGNYVISKKQKVILEAYLGTCVGVTLCDRKAGVGGLIHFLLPEPTGLERPWKAEVYASTGLPKFIQALCEAGANKNKLEASIAGGSLVGPVSRLDLDLDIGGRTTEVVRTILREDGMLINNEETGGFSGCRLSLDLQTLKTSIQPIYVQSPLISNDLEKPTSEDISNIIHLVRPIPQIALKIARMINNGDYDMREAAGEIKQDQIISARVIKLCNSSFIGLKKKIDSIDRAIIILGEKMLLKLVISASLELFFSDQEQGGYSLIKGGLYRHALGTALISEELAGFTGRVSSDIAYTAGLLHDIGKVVLDQYMAKVNPFFYRRTQEDGIELCEAEKEIFGISHPETGKLLAENWSIPENLVDTILHHHYPEHATLDPELTHIVYLADLLMSRFQVGQEIESLNMDNLSSRLQKVGLSTSEFPVIIDLIPPGIFDASYDQTI